MAKKPTPKSDVDTSEMTDEEISALAVDAVSAEPELPALVAAPTKPAPYFVTSFNNGTLAEANAAARAEYARNQAILDEAHKTALAAVNKAFAGTGAPMSVIEAALVRK